MSLYLVSFYFFGVVSLLGALGLLFSKNVFYSSLLLIVSLLSIAALYVLAFAEFLAVTQILVYAGGILVVIIFGIMLTIKFGNLPLHVKHGNTFSGALVVLPLLGLLAYLINGFKIPSGLQSPLDQHQRMLEEIGLIILTDYVIVFELAGLLLLIALVGAAVIASHKPLDTK